ncbi:hypothetical protein ACE1CD_00765 [Aerosakkonema sp. BLCC-F183]|uniref:hypothetical protein n=1 Tax=Aerosakkonema sp. BLCC-F183 TaxID=3342834 RepID=UPI0035B79DAB
MPQAIPKLTKNASLSEITFQTQLTTQSPARTACFLQTLQNQQSSNLTCGLLGNLSLSYNPGSISKVFSPSTILVFGEGKQAVLAATPIIGQPTWATTDLGILLTSQAKAPLHHPQSLEFHPTNHPTNKSEKQPVEIISSAVENVAVNGLCPTLRDMAKIPHAGVCLLLKIRNIFHLELNLFLKPQ